MSNLGVRGVETRYAQRVLEARQSRITSWVLPIASMLGLLLTLFAWAVASPVGASPDEDFHLVSIWCANDGVPKLCEQASGSTDRNVSSTLLSTSCYAHEPNIGAACQTQSGVFNRTHLVPTSRGNFEGKYPDLFYASLHQFASDDVQSSVVKMRLFNATLFVLILVALWMLLPLFLRSTLYFVTALTVVPLGLFFIPSVNPSSWAIMSVVAVFFGTVGALQEDSRKRYALWAIASMGILMAAGSRFDGLIYASIALLAGFLVAKRFIIPRKVFWILVSVLSLLGVLVLLNGGVAFAENLMRLAGESSNSNGRTGFALLAANAAAITQLWAGFSGAMGLGWLDTQVPPTAWMTAAALLWGGLYSRLGALHGRQLWAGISTLSLLAIVPLVVLQVGHSIVGENVQSRYLFPLLLVVVGLFFYRGKNDKEFFSRAQILVIMTGLFGSQALTIFMNMSRYISGVGGEGFTWNLNQAAASGWWWPTGPSPMTVLAVSIISFGMFLSGALLFQREKSEPLGISKANSIAV